MKFNLNEVKKSLKPYLICDVNKCGRIIMKRTREFLHIKKQQGFKPILTDFDLITLSRDIERDYTDLICKENKITDKTIFYNYYTTKRKYLDEKEVIENFKKEIELNGYVTI